MPGFEKEAVAGTKVGGIRRIIMPQVHSRHCVCILDIVAYQASVSGALSSPDTGLQQPTIRVYMQGNAVFNHTNYYTLHRRSWATPTATSRPPAPAPPPLPARGLSTLCWPTREWCATAFGKILFCNGVVAFPHGIYLGGREGAGSRTANQGMVRMKRCRLNRRTTQINKMMLFNTLRGCKSWRLPNGGISFVSISPRTATKLSADRQDAAVRYRADARGQVSLYFL